MDNRPLTLENQLKAYKKKYYSNKAVKGLVIFAVVLLCSFLLINAIEFSGRLNSVGRAVLMYGFIVVNLALFYGLSGRHLLMLKQAKKQISNEEAARQIGQYFPDISDKLLNLLQLEKLSADENELLLAGIRQKTAEIQHIPFVGAIDLKANSRYLKYLYGPVLSIIILLAFLPEFISESSTRIIHYNKMFLPAPPFYFSMGRPLLGFKGEPFRIDIKTEGRTNPEAVFVRMNDRKIKADKKGEGAFAYRISRLDGDITFKLEAEGVNPESYTIRVYERPSLSLFNINISYPDYTGLKDEVIRNSGNLNIPEGTQVSWQFHTVQTRSLSIFFERKDENITAEKVDATRFEVERILDTTTPYTVKLQNEHSGNKDSLKFNINIIKDRFPQITFEQFQDTTFYKKLVLGGRISDDYGFSGLDFFYTYAETEAFKSIPLPFNPVLNDQSYYYVFELDSVKIQAGSKLQYYVQASDNDKVNGYKTVKSATYSFKVPSIEKIEAALETQGKQIKNEIDRTLKKAKSLNEMIEEADKRLKTKKQMEWQDEKLIQEILDQKEKLSTKLEELKKENERHNRKREQFKAQDERIKQKMKQLQEIMEDVLDEETKKQYDELRKLLEKHADIEEFRDKINTLQNHNKKLEEDLERTLELFKKLQFDIKLEENIKQLQKEIEDQEALNEATEKGEKDNETLAREQKNEQEDIERLKEKLKQLNELNRERKNPEHLPKDFQEELEDIKEEQQKAQEALDLKQENDPTENQTEDQQEKNKAGQQNDAQQRQKASKPQKRAAEKMKEVKQRLQAMQNNMQMQQMEENMENLRNLADNLVTLSFNQEELMNHFKEIAPGDPRYVKLSERQLKLRDDSQIIQDSLVALSQRVFPISSFIMRELGEMNRQMDDALLTLKEKKISQAVGKQQFAMTSINNLALLLDDVLQQMQQQMTSQMGISKGRKPRKNNLTPGAGLSELQQKLSEQIQELKKSGKSGRKLSEGLARLASQQERLRNALENFERGPGENKLGKKIDKLVEQMQENEWDLIHKNITPQTLERQKEILTRLLETERAIQERGEDEERKGETATDYDPAIPESLNEYLKIKEKEIELLKTIPPKLNRYYKRETNRYFKRIRN